MNLITALWRVLNIHRKKHREKSNSLTDAIFTLAQ